MPMQYNKVKLGDICTITKGAIGIMKAIPGEYQMVTLGETNKTHNEYQFDAKAVIVPLVSSTGHGHASMKQVKYFEGKFALGNILCAIIPKDENIVLAKYLHIYLHWNRNELLVSQMKGMANVSLPVNRIADVTITLPDLDTQKRIIEQVQTLQTEIETLQAEPAMQLSLLDKLDESILSSINNEESKIKRVKLGGIIEYANNLDIQKKLLPDAIINYVDIESIDNQNYKIREVKKKIVSQLSTRARRVLKLGYIIYSTVRPYLKNIAIIENDLDNYIGSTGFLVFKTIDEVYLKYVFYFLLTPDVNANFAKLMNGFNSPSITNEQFEDTLIPLPSLSEQKRIISEIERQLAITKQLRKEVRQNQVKVEKLLQSELQKVFNT